MMKKNHIFRVCRQKCRHGKEYKRKGARLIVLPLVVGILLWVTGCSLGGDFGPDYPDTSDESYGVFLGIDSSTFDINDFEGYDMVVIDAQELRSDQLAQLHARGHVVYSYLNVGSIEITRDYYDKFEDICLDSYTNWPDEYWIDVTQKKWQKFTGVTLTQEILEKDPDIDGLFLDNLDVYFHVTEKKKYRSMKDDVYESLIKILGCYKEAELPVLINGADMFVKRLMKEGQEDLIQGVNQETVFSAILDYDRDKFGEQPADETEYYTDYLEECKEAGIDVFLLEYTKDKSVERDICNYCEENGFRYYISKHVNLIAPDE